MKIFFRIIITVLLVSVLLLSVCGCEVSHPKTGETSEITDGQSSENGISAQMLPKQKKFTLPNGEGFDMTFQWAENGCVVRMPTYSVFGYKDENGETHETRNEMIVEIEGIYAPESRLLTTVFKTIENEKSYEHQTSLFYFDENGLINQYELINDSDSFVSPVEYENGQISLSFIKTPVDIKVSDDFRSAQIEAEGKEELFSVSVTEDGHVYTDMMTEMTPNFDSKGNLISLMSSKGFGISEYILSDQKATAAWQVFMDAFLDYPFFIEAARLVENGDPTWSNGGLTWLATSFLSVYCKNKK